MTEFYIGDKANPSVYIKNKEQFIIVWFIGYCIVSYVSAFIKEWVREYLAIRRFKKDKEQNWKNIHDKLSGEFKSAPPPSPNRKSRLN